jgi:hypothetical protein
MYLDFTSTYLVVPHFFFLSPALQDFVALLDANMPDVEHLLTADPSCEKKGDDKVPCLEDEEFLSPDRMRRPWIHGMEEAINKFELVQTNTY